MHPAVRESKLAMVETGISGDSPGFPFLERAIDPLSGPLVDSVVKVINVGTIVQVLIERIRPFNDGVEILPRRSSPLLS